jgi:hypothetical protein
MALKKGRLSASVSAESTPVQTGIPDLPQPAHPAPIHERFGSADPANTRATPAARMASVHGGVRPKWSQGSRVVKRSAPRARGPASSMARTSACGPPAGAV